MLTYRAFATPRQVLESLTEAYQLLAEADDGSDPTQYKKAARLRICSLLGKWVSQNFHDFEDKELIELYYQTAQIISESDPKLGASLKQKMNAQIEGKEKHRIHMFSAEAPPAVLPRSGITASLFLS